MGSKRCPFFVERSFKMQKSPFITAIKERGLSMRAVAGYLGISRAALYKKLDGEIRLSADELFRLASLLDISMDQLYKLVCPGSDH